MLQQRTQQQHPTTDQATDHEIGYSTMLALDGPTPVACVIIPHVFQPTFAIARETSLRIGNSSTTLVLRDLPQGLVNALSECPERVFVIGADTLTSIGIAQSFKALSERKAAAQGPNECNKTLNMIMTSASGANAIVMQNWRLLTRQRETEAFVRKLAASFRKLFPMVAVEVASQDLPNPSRTSGPIETSKASCNELGILPALSKYLPYPSARMTSSAHAPHPADLFPLLHNAVYGHLAQSAASTPALASSAASVAIELAGLGTRLQKEAKAADSVFINSFCDSYALMCIAAVSGVEAAGAILKKVLQLRGAAGDLTAYSEAPLSHDTSAALAIVKAQLAHNIRADQYSPRELVGMSIWMAADGLDIWIQGRGHDASIGQAVSTNIMRLLGWAGHASFKR